jgi:hypothetical protein
MMPPNLTAALKLVGAGFRVLGCYPDTKRPVRGLSWRGSACVEPVQVVNYWKYQGRGVDLMPAIDLEHAGLVVLDLDVGHADGVDGIAALNALCDRNGEIPRCPVVRTPSGGAHLCLKQPSGRPPLGNSEGSLPDGINVRGAGGYVIGVGAVRDDGTFYEREGRSCHQGDKPQHVPAARPRKYGGRPRPWPAAQPPSRPRAIAASLSKSQNRRSMVRFRAADLSSDANVALTFGRLAPRSWASSLWVHVSSGWATAANTSKSRPTSASQRCLSSSLIVATLP